MSFATDRPSTSGWTCPGFGVLPDADNRKIQR
jgi:hypothetical protein